MRLYKVMFLLGRLDRDGILRKQFLEYYSQTSLLFFFNNLHLQQVFRWCWHCCSGIHRETLIWRTWPSSWHSVLNACRVWRENVRILYSLITHAPSSLYRNTITFSALSVLPIDSPDDEKRMHYLPWILLWSFTCILKLSVQMSTTVFMVAIKIYHSLEFLTYFTQRAFFFLCRMCYPLHFVIGNIILPLHSLNIAAT